MGTPGGGQGSGFGDFKGQVAILCFYDRALSDSEIANNHTAALARTLLQETCGNRTRFYRLVKEN